MDVTKKLLEQSKIAKKEKNVKNLLIIKTNFENFLHYADSEDSNVNNALYANVLQEYISIITHLVYIDDFAHPKKEIDLLYDALSFDPTNINCNYNLGYLYENYTKFPKNAICHYNYAKEIGEYNNLLQQYINIKNVSSNEIQTRISTLETQIILEKSRLAKLNGDVQSLLESKNEIEKYLTTDNKILLQEHISIVSHLAFFDKYININWEIEMLYDALLFSPSDGMCHYNLGHLYRKSNKLSKAICHYQLCLLECSYIDAYLEFGIVLKDQKRYKKAIKMFLDGLKIKECPKILNELGVLYSITNRKNEALKYFSRAFKCLETQSFPVNTVNNTFQGLLKILNNKSPYKILEIEPGCNEEIIKIAYTKQLTSKNVKKLTAAKNILLNFKNEYQLYKGDELKATLYINMGYISSNIGRIEESLDYYQKAMNINKNNLLSFQNTLLNINYTFKSPEEIFQTFKNCAEKVVKASLKVEYTPEVASKPTDIVKIGYVSGDFFGHCCNFFSRVLLVKFSSNFRVYCYSNGELDVNELQMYSPKIKWKVIKHLDTYNAAKCIAEDKLHILVDLSGHTSNNRLDVFCYRLARIQITYLGFPATTALPLMDYRIVDKYTDVCTDSFNTEKLIKLDKCFLCYTNPLTIVVPVKTPEKNNIVFGSFNKFNKLNTVVIKIWDTILSKASNLGYNVKMVLKGSFYTDHNAELVNLFSSENKSKICILKKTKSFEEHINCYKFVDISLDTFPYNSTTTACESLWSGVPVIGLYRPKEDRKHVSSVCGSILINSGLEDWIASSEDEYINLALQKISDLNLLYKTKCSLRNKFLNCRVTNQVEFMKDFENALMSVIYSIS